MKKSVFLLLLILGTSLFANAQNPHTKNKILGLEFHAYKTSDIGITKSKNLLEVEKKVFRIPYNKDDFKLNILEKSKIKKGKITNYLYKSSYMTSEYNFKYSKNFKTLLKQIYVKAKDNYEDASFIFDKKNNVIQLETYLKRINSRVKKHYDYNDSNHTITEYILKSDGKKHKVIKYKTDKKGNIIYKNIKHNSYKPYDKIFEFVYDKGKVIQATKYDDLKDPSKKRKSKATSNYTYNDKGLIIENKGNLTKSEINFDHHFIYEYVYDNYGNWIVQYKFKTTYGFEDLKDQNYKDIVEITLRKLTYKKETTGTTNLQTSSIQNYLKNVAANNPFKTKNAPKDGVYWEKTKDRSMKLHSNGKYITKNCNLLTILKNDFYVNDSVNNKMYILKDFVLKPKNKAFYKATLFASNDELVWGKNKVKEFYIYKNGKIDPSKLVVTGFTQHQFIYDVDHNISYLLEDFSTKEVDVFYKVKPLKGNAFFFKTKTGNFGIIVNGRQVVAVNPKYAENGMDVILKAKTGNTTYLLKNFKNIAYLTLGEVIIQK